MPAGTPVIRPPSSASLEVLLAFLRLGLSCFGGPVAHLGYFRAEFVARRRWLDEDEFADLVGLCQFLPGPASSQTGFAIGLLRAGYLGGLAAWLGFTLPSAALMLAFASAAPGMMRSAAGGGVIHGLKLVAVAIVAQAVWGMARSLCPDRQRALIAIGAVAGLVVCRDGASMPPIRPLHLREPVSRRVAAACLAVFASLLLVLPLFHGLGFGESVFRAFFRVGAGVFGGGHVVLPLLRDAVVAPGWISADNFLAGYGAAQALPGPLFTLAAFLGFSLRGTLHGPAGAAIALIAIFLPGLLLVTGLFPFWRRLRGRPVAEAAMRGVNAAVVGILAAALYDPVWVGAVFAPSDAAAALVGFVLLVGWRAPPLLIVGLGAAFGLGAAIG